MSTRSKKPGRGNPKDRAKRTEAPTALSDKDCRQIARAYDGTSECIHRLLAEWSARLPGIKRYTIVRAAARGGYQSRRERRSWTEREDRFVQHDWHLRSGDQIAQALSRSFTSVNLRRKRLGIGRYDGDEYTIHDLEELTGLDHRQWHDFMARGWLRALSRDRRQGAAPIIYVSVLALLEEARREWVESQGRSAFIDITVPETAVRFKQQLGRLLRTSEDSATVSVLDRGRVTKCWGGLLMRGLPDFRIVVEPGAKPKKAPAPADLTQAVPIGT